MKTLNKTSMVILISIGLLAACRKEKLSSEYSYLYGKWKWIYTYRNYGEPDFAEYSPSTEGADYSLEISKKHIVFYKNGKKEFKRYFKDISVHPGDTDTSVIGFFIGFNKKDGFLINYYPARTYIEVTRFPFNYVITSNLQNPTKDGFTYVNYFQKQ